VVVVVVLLRSTGEKVAQLEVWLVRRAETIVFGHSHKFCDFVAKAISILHGGKTQDAREAAIDAFRNKRTSILLATDVAGRGIDVPDVGLVVNYQLPATIEAYTHRIGRTGRAGRKGVAVSLATGDDAGLFFDLRNFLQDSGNTVPPELAAHPASRKKYEKGDKFGRNIET
jgi:ATP-dependent RNA helicase DDX23/PRP28